MFNIIVDLVKLLLKRNEPLSFSEKAKFLRN